MQKLSDQMAKVTGDLVKTLGAVATGSLDGGGLAVWGLAL